MYSNDLSDLFNCNLIEQNLMRVASVLLSLLHNSSQSKFK